MAEFTVSGDFPTTGSRRRRGGDPPERIPLLPPLSSRPNKGVNVSHCCTVGTETTSFSDDGEESEGVEPQQDELLFSTGAFRIDDLLHLVGDDDEDDERDSVSMAAIRTSLIDGDDHSFDFIADGLPREIIVLEDEEEDTAMETREGNVTDVSQRLRIAETLVRTYRDKMRSTEDMTDNLHEFLIKAQTYAEDVLADRDELLREIETMHEEEQLRMDKLLLLKVLMASSLCYYVCGGSPALLTYSVGFFLLVDTLSTLV